MFGREAGVAAETGIVMLMMGDRADVIFASPDEISGFICLQRSVGFRTPANAIISRARHT
jgi:hypothetical protein